MNDYDPFDWMDDPLRFWEGLVITAALTLAVFAVVAAIALFIAHYPG